MAVPPTIPTSFVPKQPVEMHPRHTESSGNMFLTVSLFILGIAIVGAGGVFGYEKYLEGRRDAKEQELKEKEAQVSDSTVEGFIRLRNRLSSAKEILDNHVMTSQLFDELEAITLENVRFSSFKYEDASGDDAGRTIKVEMQGVAKSFNALAAQSAKFAKDGSRIRRAIFSDISADENGVVSFSLSANVDSRLITIPSGVPTGWSADASVPAPDAAADAAVPADTTTTTP